MSFLIDLIGDVGKFLFDIPFYIYVFTKAILSSFIGCILPTRKVALDGTTILVTGAAVGLGKSVVINIAETSKKVTFVLWDINEQGLQETSDTLKKLGANVYYYVVDLSNHQEIITTAEKVRKDVGAINILFNNAGIASYSTFLEANPAMEEKVMQVNLMSYIWTIREFLPQMIACGRGHVISTCSQLGHFAHPYLSSYVASKFGLRGLMETIKLEISMHPEKPDIKFSTVYPGWIKTPMTQDISWTPRYKTLTTLAPMDPEHVSQEMVKGIKNQTEHIYVPGILKYTTIFASIMSSILLQRVNNHLFRDFTFDSSKKPGRNLQATDKNKNSSSSA